MDHTLASAHHVPGQLAPARPPIDGVKDPAQNIHDEGVVDENPTYDAVMQVYQASGKDTERFRYSQLQLDRFFKGRTVPIDFSARISSYVRNGQLKLAVEA